VYSAVEMFALAEFVKDIQRPYAQKHGR